MTYCISITGDQMKDQKVMDTFQQLLNASFDAMEEEVQIVAKELNVSENCANDIVYLRSRSRWTQELENKLIALHKAGNPPNMMEFE